jgi:hypothetical protein
VYEASGLPDVGALARAPILVIGDTGAAIPSPGALTNARRGMSQNANAPGGAAGGAVVAFESTDRTCHRPNDLWESAARAAHLCAGCLGEGSAQGAMDAAITLWRCRGDARDGAAALDCAVEQLGESYFELCLRAGAQLLSCEPFEDAAALLRRAEQLRVERAGVID